MWRPVPIDEFPKAEYREALSVAGSIDRIADQFETEIDCYWEDGLGPAKAIYFCGDSAPSMIIKELEYAQQYYGEVEWFIVMLPEETIGPEGTEMHKSTVSMLLSYLDLSRDRILWSARD